jgi:hypothetical protein
MAVSPALMLFRTKAFIESAKDLQRRFHRFGGREFDIVQVIGLLDSMTFLAAR